MMTMAMQLLQKQMAHKEYLENLAIDLVRTEMGVRPDQINYVAELVMPSQIDMSGFQKQGEEPEEEEIEQNFQEKEEDLENYFEKIRNKPLQVVANNSKLMEPEELDNTQKAVKEKPGKRIKVKKTHVVKRGDSLYSLSKKYGTTVDALKKVNRLKKEALQVGQKIKIPKK